VDAHQDWLTTEQAAQELGVARQTVSRWIREGKLRGRAIRVHGRTVYRIRRSDWKTFVGRYIRDSWA
jgi:excisionase family DNA binding protein